VCSDNVAQTSGLIARSSSCGEIGLFGPLLTQESAISPLPLDLKLSRARTGLFSSRTGLTLLLLEGSLQVCRWAAFAIFGLA
jgi:hypothetical protein